MTGPPRLAWPLQGVSSDLEREAKKRIVKDLEAVPDVNEPAENALVIPRDRISSFTFWLIRLPGDGFGQ